MSRFTKWAAGTALAIAAFAATNPASAQLRGRVAVDGSSTVYPITEAVAEEFASVQPRIRVTVGISGTGGGFKRFTVGETDISDASRPIKAAEFQAATDNNVDFIEIPVAYDGLTIVVNKENSFIDKLTVADLQKIFLDAPGMAKTWKDVNAAWPATPIKIYAPGTDSGTFDYFKEVVADEGSIRSDMSVSEDDNVLVTGVSGDRGAIGFFGAAYYFENTDTLRAVPIVNSDGKAVTPSSDTIESGEYNPFSRPLFIYVSAKSAQKPEVDAFVKFYFEVGPELAEEVGYVRLPSSVYETAKRKYNNRETGTSYTNAAGEAVKGPVTQVYK